jgi:hypothetical protein
MALAVLVLAAMVPGLDYKALPAHTLAYKIQALVHN